MIRAVRRRCRNAVLWAGLICAALIPSLALAAQPPHHTILLSAGPAKGTVRISAAIAIFGQRAIKLRITPWLQVSSIRVDGKSYAARTRDGSLRLFLPGWRRHLIEIAAEATISSGGSGEGNAPFAKAGWLYLPGEFWFPQVDAEATSYRLTVEVPPPYRAVATGRFETEELGPQVNRSVFTSENAAEPPSVFAGPYLVSERLSGGVRLRTYFPQSAAALADGYLDAAERYIQRFAAEIGPYPFADFHIVAAPLPVGLGFPGLTYIDERILPLPFIRERSLGHETLHNWWGNGVIPDYKHGNWSEGLTTYMADHNLAAARDTNDALEMRLGWLRDFAALPAEKDMPAELFFSRSHDASQIVGYGKVAFIFHMLKEELGEERFNAAIRRFWQEYRHRKAGWDDIRAVFEAQAGTDLKWFFDQWLKRPGAPMLTVARTRIIPAGGGFDVEITLSQPSPYYRLKVPVEIVTAAGAMRIRIPLDGAESTATIRLDARPVEFRLDPDYALFRRLRPGEAPPILRDVLLDDGARAIVLTSDPASYDLARELLARPGSAPAPISTADEPSIPLTALLVVGTTEDMTRFLARPGMRPRPAAVAGQGTARVWVAARENGKPILFIEGNTVDALRNLARPLPHYRGKSTIVFDGVKASVKAPSRAP